MDDEAFVRNIRESLELSWGGPVDVSFGQKNRVDVDLSCTPPRVCLGQEILQPEFGMKLRSYVEYVRLSFQLQRLPTWVEMRWFMERN